MCTLTFLPLTRIKIIVIQLLVLMCGFAHSLYFSISKYCNNLFFIERSKGTFLKVEGWTNFTVTVSQTLTLQALIPKAISPSMSVRVWLHEITQDHGVMSLFGCQILFQWNTYGLTVVSGAIRCIPIKTVLYELTTAWTSQSLPPSTAHKKL